MIPQDRAARIAASIVLIIRTTRYLHEIRRQVEDMLREELSDAARQARDEIQNGG